MGVLFPMSANARHPKLISHPLRTGGRERKRKNAVNNGHYGQHTYFNRNNFIFNAVLMVSIVPLIVLWVETMWEVEDRVQKKSRGCQ